MPENIITLLLLLVLCHGNYGIISNFLSSFFTSMDITVLHAFSAALTILLFGLLFVLSRFFIGKAASVLRQFNLPDVWHCFQQSICLRTVLHLIFGVAGSAAAGTLLLMAVYRLPVAPIQQHLAEDIPYTGADSDHTYPSLSPFSSSMIDGYTDSLILLESGSDISDTLLHKALLVPRSKLSSQNDSDINPAQTLYAHYIKGVPFTAVATYARYWHGYLVLTKPLLSVFNFRQIQILNGIVQLGLVVLVCWLLKRRALGAYIPAFLLVWLMLIPPALFLCMQFTPCWLIALVCTLLLLWMDDAHLASHGWLIFLYSGIAVAYFDFLTYPLMAFGIPAVFYVLLMRQQRSEYTLARLIQSGIVWGWGYAAMWASKWILATLFTSENVLRDAFSQAALRSSSSTAVSGISCSAISALFANLGLFFFTPASLAVLAFILYTAYKMYRAGHLPWTQLQGQLLFYSLLGVLPVLWYLLLRNHSYIHSWFTKNALSVFVLCILFSCTAILELVCQQISSAPKH